MRSPRILFFFLWSLALLAPWNVLADTVLFKDSEFSSGALGLGPFQTFMSSPSKPAIWNFVVPYNDSTADQIEPGLIFIAPRGPDVKSQGALIYDKSGHLIWDGTEYGQTLTFRVSTYKNESVILLWTGEFFESGTGSGYDLILNNQYEVIANFTADLNGTLADFHDIELTENDTALITAYQAKNWDLSLYNIADGWLLDSVLQEIDPETGNALFTWKASDWVDVNSCYTTPGSGGTAADNAWDFFHINAVNKDNFGNYLISSRHCHTLFYVGPDGNIIWTIGGKSSSVFQEENTIFAWQHDARWESNQTQISLFDNEGTAWETDSTNSRGLLLNFNAANNTVSLANEWIPYNINISESQGNVDIMPSGNTLIGWGQLPWLSEYDADGRFLYVVQFGVGNVQSYRAYHFNWTAAPNTLPSVFVAASGSNTTVYTSWNGATEVATWQLSGSTSESPQLPVPLSNTSRSGFETAISVLNSGTNYTYYQVAALNSNNEIIAYSNFTAANGMSMPPATNQTDAVSSENSTISSTTSGSASGATSTSSATTTTTSPSSGSLKLAAIDSRIMTFALAALCICIVAPLT